MIKFPVEVHYLGVLREALAQLPFLHDDTLH